MDRSRVLAWALTPERRVPAVRNPPDLEFAVVPDRRPAVQIVVPGEDTALGSDLILPLVVDAADDNGLAHAQIVSWRSSKAGSGGEVAVLPLMDTGAASARLIVRPLLNARGHGLLPGDTIVYFARVRDAHPRHPWATSDTFRARLPTLVELRTLAADGAETLATETADALAETGRLARTARQAERRASSAPTDLQREGATEGQGGGDFSSTEEGRKVLEDGRKLERQLQEMGGELAALRRYMEHSNLADSAIQRRLGELAALYAEILHSDLGSRLEELAAALRDLSHEHLSESLGGLAGELDSLQERLDRSVALMERVATEQALKGALERAEELTRLQRNAAESYADDESWARREETLAEGVGRLGEELDALQDRLAKIGMAGPAQNSGNAGRMASLAAADMRAAAEAARRAATAPGSRDWERGVGSALRAASAADSMEQATADLRAASEALRRDWKTEAVGALDRATREALDLASEQSRLGELAREGGASAALAGRQASLRQGLDNLLRSLADAGRRTALVDRRVGPAAAQVAGGMETLSERMASGTPGGEPTADASEELAEALNDLARQLIGSRRAVEMAESATGMEEALEQLARAGRIQATLNDESASLFVIQDSGRRIAARLQDVARRQAEVGRQLSEIPEATAAAVITGRPDELAREAEELAGRLAAGVLDRETLARQRRLFRRLLDAGRSLEKDDRDPDRRESATATPIPSSELPEQDPSVFAGPRYPYPVAEELQAIDPGRRRLVLEYFDRLNRSSPSAPESDSSAGGPP